MDPERAGAESVAHWRARLESTPRARRRGAGSEALGRGRFGRAPGDLPLAGGGVGIAARADKIAVFGQIDVKMIAMGFVVIRREHDIPHAVAV